MNRTIIDEYFVNLAKIIGGNSPQSISSLLLENWPQALIDQFDVPGTLNKLVNLIPSRFSNSTILAFLVLVIYYTILQLFHSTKFFPIKFFFISSMGTTL